MPRARAQRRDIKAAGFALTDDNRRELSDQFPRVDIDQTFELFTDNALAKGWLYADWLAAFRNYIRNGAKYGGVAYVSRFQDPAWESLLKRAKDLGFREPMTHESPSTYRQFLDAYDHESAARGFRQLNLGDAIKRVDK